MSRERLFDSRTPPERTSLAWERTAFSGMVVGLLIARVGAPVHPVVGFLGVVPVCASAVLLVWSGRHYEDLHARLRAGERPRRQGAVVGVGVGAVATTVLASVVTAAAAVTGR